MNEVLVIGPTVETINCHLHSKLEPNTINNATITSTDTGGCFYLAVNLARFGVHTNYISRFANDNDAQKLWNILDSNNIFVFSSGELEGTPKEINIIDDKNYLTRLQQATLDIYPNDPTIIPNVIITKCDYAYIDVIDLNFTSFLLYRFPHVKWIARQIPSDALLPSIEGIALSYRDATDIAEENDFAELASRLLVKGVKWVIITKEDKGIYFFSSNISNYYAFDLELHQSFGGLYEFYLSLLLTCLAREVPIEQAVLYSNEQFVNSLSTSATR